MSSWSLLWTNNRREYICLLSMYAWLYRNYMQSMFVLIYDSFIWFYLSLFFWIGYFTCTAPGLFPDTAYCGIGKYFYCPQAGGGKYSTSYLIWLIYLFNLAPVSASCPPGQNFNRFTNQCDPTYQCTWIWQIILNQNKNNN